MKEIVAIREKKKVNKVFNISVMAILSAVCIIFGIVTFFQPEVENAVTLGTVLVVLGVVFIGLIFLILKAIKRIEKTNTYPEPAVVIEGEFLYVVTDKLEKIPLKDIKKVKGNNEIVTGVFVRVIKSSGNLTIKTENKKYVLTQIKNVQDSAKLIKSYLKK